MTTAAATRAQSPEEHVLNTQGMQMICAVNNRTAQTLKVSERWPPKLVPWQASFASLAATPSGDLGSERYRAVL